MWYNQNGLVVHCLIKVKLYVSLTVEMSYGSLRKAFYLELLVIIEQIVFMAFQSLTTFHMHHTLTWTP